MAQRGSGRGSRRRSSDRDDAPPFQSERIEGVGNISQAPKVISGKNAKTTAVVLSVAANSRANDRYGEVVEGVRFRELKLFGYDAEYAVKVLDKGDEICYSGRLSPKEYETRDGDLVETDEILIERLYPTMRCVDRMINGKPESSPSQRRSRGRGRDEDYEDDFGDVEDTWSEEDDQEPEERPRRGSGRSGGRASRSSRSGRSARGGRSSGRAARREEPEDDGFADDEAIEALESETPPKKRSSKRRSSSRTKPASEKIDIDEDVESYGQEL